MTDLGPIISGGAPPARMTGRGGKSPWAHLALTAKSQPDEWHRQDFSDVKLAGRARSAMARYMAHAERRGTVVWVRAKPDESLVHESDT